MKCYTGMDDNVVSFLTSATILIALLFRASTMKNCGQTLRISWQHRVRAYVHESSRGWRLLAASILILCAFDVAHAQKTTFDYYAAKADKTGEARRLATVEQYHLEQADQKSRAGNY